MSRSRSGGGPPFLLLRITTRPFEAWEPLWAPRAAAAARDLAASEEALVAEAAALCDRIHAAAGERPGDDPERSRARLAAVALRRDLHNARVPSPGRLEVARPLLSGDLAAQIEGHLRRRREEIERLRRFREAFWNEALAARRALMGAAREAVVEEGLRLASRSLLDAAREASRSDPSRWSHRERHAAAKTAAYLARFATKPSPNAVFASTAPAAFEDAARVEGENGIARVDVLLSVAEARKIAAALAVDAALEDAIVPRVNGTLRARADGWTWWRPSSLRDPGDEETLCRAKEHPVARAIVEEAARGAPSLEGIVREMSERFEHEPEAMRAFVRSLVERGIIIAEVDAPYLSRRPLADLARLCRHAGCAPGWIEGVESIEAEIARLPSLGPAGRVEEMDRIQERLERLPSARALREDEIFRVDAATSLRVTLPASVLDELRREAGRYARLFASLYPERAYVKRFARRFLSRHPADTEVEALEIYHGLFEPEETPRPSAFPSSWSEDAEDGGRASRAFARARGHFVRLAHEAEARGEREIALGSADWDALLEGVPEPVWNGGVVFQIAARDASSIDAGAYRCVLNAIYAGAGMALARFAHLHGGDGGGERNPVVTELRRQWSWASESGAIPAEITYMHHGRTANAGLRPPIFEHEIELPGWRPTPGARVLPLADLTVRWDSSRERFVLRSIALGREILPLVNSGISPEGFVLFLLAIGRQGWQPVSLFPGFDVNGIEHWPRITSGRTVLFRERWVFTETPFSPEATEADLFLEVARWRRRHRIPRHVFAHTADDPKPFYVDLESPLSLDLLRRAIRSAGREVRGEPERGALHLTEMLPAPDEMWARDRNGRYASEFLVHLEGGSRPPAP